MPAPARPCRIPTCPQLRPCSAHGDVQSWGNKRTDIAISGYEWQRRRTRVIDRDGGVCRLQLTGCTVVAVTADHIIGTAEGGSDDESNLQASCAECNESRRIEQARAGRERR